MGLLSQALEVRFGGRGIAGDILLSEIYAMACSETERTPFAPFLKRKLLSTLHIVRLAPLAPGSFCSRGSLFLGNSGGRHLVPG